MEWLLRLVTAAPLKRGPHGRKTVVFLVSNQSYTNYICNSKWIYKVP